ncbi:MAG: hypothetical protein JRF40_06790 [Deltaproteobacteria bacterium]|nr:hypothetical protein [Deltaproteobacteria bacterium]MBW2219180.1 hypothetical protein [Deltaproteobacteria bacterium]
MNTEYQDEYVKIIVLDSAIEAQLVESILSEQEIPYRLRSFHDTAYDGLFQVQKGWGEIFAPLSLKQEIVDIVEDIRSSSHEI